MLVAVASMAAGSVGRGADPAPKSVPLDYSIVIHGGAGSSAQDLGPQYTQEIVQSLTAALKIGRQSLEDGESSLDAVEKVIRYMEDNPTFNAGRGAVFNSAGGHELDSSIMDGRDRACGAVAGVTTIKNPISLARLVMTETRHVLLAGAGAERFGEEMEVERVENSYFSTDVKRRSWERVKQRDANAQTLSRRQPYLGTVGCVALDKRGNLAAGTSTGGVMNKKFGRVGDSPIVGAGTFADNRTCAVSCTGVGEHYIRNAIAYDVSAQMAYKKVSLSEAVRDVIHNTLQPGDGGIIAVARDGTIVTDFNTGGMAQACADSTGRFEAKIGK